MREISISKKYVAVNLIRYCSLSAVSALLLCPVFSGIFVLIPVGLLAVVLLLLIFYIPMRAKSLRCSFERGNLFFRSGVFFSHEVFVPEGAIMQRLCRATPLQRLFKVHDLVFYLPRQKIVLPCIDD